MEKVLTINKWKTISYPENKKGTAEIKHFFYDKGFYLMEGVGGYLLADVKKKIQLHSLSINGEEVMLDDPLHWLGMKLIAEASIGKVLVGGLGLGLIVHHLVNNKEVKKIVIYEINKDVIDLIKPLLPKDKRIKIVNKDFFYQPWRKDIYNTIINDLWIKSSFNKLKVAGSNDDFNIYTQLYTLKANLPNDTKIFFWGMRDRKHNPAVTIDVPDHYLDMVKRMKKRGGKKK